MKKPVFTCRKNPFVRLVFLITLWLFINPTDTYAQTWSSIANGGASDWVYSSVMYNGDLIVGGKFTAIGGVSANHIARYDGTTWYPLGEGVTGNVQSLIVYNGMLVAAGEFTMAGGLEVNFIAQWDGTSWNDELGGVGSTVTSLAIIGDTIYAGGYFTEADNTPVQYIAKRDTSGWVELGGGMGGGGSWGSQVMALYVFNGELYAGGFFNTAGGQPASHIAKWDGTSWSALGNGINNGISNIVYTLGEYNGELIAGGLFLSAGGNPANNIAAWNGSSWSPLGGGMTGIFYQYVFALAEYNGKLIAGGYFTESDGITTNGVAQWDGNSWSEMAGGLFYPGNVFGAHNFTVYGTDLVVGGLFSTAGTENVSHIAKWTDTTVIFCPGDFDNNGVINTADLLLLMSNFACMSSCGVYDLDGNSAVNTGDLLQFMSMFGTNCP